MFKVRPITSDLSAKMANMSFLCACMIVIFHATPAPEMGTFTWWICHLIGREGICKIAVPWFFVASGFLLAGHIEETGWWLHAVAKRMKSLVVPFYVWMIVSFVFGFSVLYLKSHVFHMQTEGRLYELGVWEQLLRLSGFHPFVDIGPLWYVRCLLFLVLVSPMIVAALRFWRLTLPVFAIALLVFSALFWSGAGENFYFFFDRFVTVRGLLYFTLGLFFRLNASMPKVVWLKWHWMLVGTIILIVENLMRLNGVRPLTGVVEALSVPFLLAGLFALIPSMRLPRCLLQSAFPMFLSHNIFLSIAALVIAVIGFRGNSEYDLLIMVARSAFAIGASIVFSTILHRFCPKMANLIFGGR